MTPDRRGLAIFFGKDPATMQKSDRRTERLPIVGGSVLYHSLLGIASLKQVLAQTQRDKQLPNCNHPAALVGTCGQNLCLLSFAFLTFRSCDYSKMCGLIIDTRQIRDMLAILSDSSMAVSLAATAERARVDRS
jgi:hypothetical protein